MNPILIVHVAAGSVALLSGAASLGFRKGGRLHGRAGIVFTAAMLVMAGGGATLAALGGERGTTAIGLLTFYLVASSWATARNRSGEAAGVERAAFVAAAAFAAAFVAFGILGSLSPKGRLDSLPAEIHYPFAALAALAAFGDLRYRRGLTGSQRIARHLWRMCAALLIAAFSFFLGQQKVMPAFMRGSPWLVAPELAVLALMIFWLFRVRLSQAFRTMPPLARGAA